MLQKLKVIWYFLTLSTAQAETAKWLNEFYVNQFHSSVEKSDNEITLIIQKRTGVK